MKSLIMLLSLMLGAVAANAEPVKLLVDFNDDATIEDVRDSEEETGLDLQPSSFMFSATKLTEVMIDSENAEEYIETLEDDGDIEAVEVSQMYFAMGGASFEVPNDPAYARQRWHMDMVGMQKAWKQSTGKGVIVAVLDTGVSPGTTPSYPRVGDLASSSFMKGYNFVDDNEDTHDAHGHGTHCSSTILEATNNSIGGVGMAFEAKLLPVKVLGDSGGGSVEGISEGIRWAVDQGAHVISMSLGGRGFSAIMANAVRYAEKRNVIVVAAAGNDADDAPHYPSAYDGVLAISAVGPGGQIGTADAGNPKTAKLATYSSYGGAGGKKGIFLAAPGGDRRVFGDEGGVIQSTIEEGNPLKWAMRSFNGTSMACPHVSGAAALVASALMEKNGGRFKSSEVIKILEKTATAREDKYKFGAGVLNAGAAVEMAAEGTSYTPFAVGGMALAIIVGFFILRRRSGEG